MPIHGQSRAGSRSFPSPEGTFWAPALVAEAREGAPARVPYVAAAAGSRCSQYPAWVAHAQSLPRLCCTGAAAKKEDADAPLLIAWALGARDSLESAPAPRGISAAAGVPSPGPASF